MAWPSLGVEWSSESRSRRLFLQSKNHAPDSAASNQPVDLFALTRPSFTSKQLTSGLLMGRLIDSKNERKMAVF